jgi:hypothetical protein
MGAQGQTVGRTVLFTEDRPGRLDTFPLEHASFGSVPYKMIDPLFHRSLALDLWRFSHLVDD